jgi:Uma2 family endonuclease
MLQVQTKLYSFAEYLNYHDDFDHKYELINGELVIMPPASGIHALIMVFLYDIFKTEIERLRKEYKVMPGNVGVRTGINKSRIPDLIILSETQCEAIKTMNTAILESPPLLAIEIVSAGNSEDDYRYKRSEYATIEIPEYWIVDSIQEKVSILSLVSGFYEVAEFKEEQCLKSLLFPELNLTVNQILQL